MKRPFAVSETPAFIMIVDADWNPVFTVATHNGPHDWYSEKDVKHRAMLLRDILNDSRDERVNLL